MSSNELSTTAARTISSLSKDLHIVVVVTSSLSLVCCLLVFASYVKFPRLRLHPSQLLFYRTLMDFVQAVVALVVSLLWLQDKSLDCHGCIAPSLIYQAAIFGSGCWYFIMAVDLYLAIRNPFICHGDYTRYYHLGVWSFTAVTVAVIGFSSQYGPDTYGVCWVRDHTCSSEETMDGLTSDPNDLTLHVNSTTSPVFFALALGVYFGPYLIMYIVTLVILGFAQTALGKGLPNSDEIRKRVLQHSFVYVLFYALQWTVYAGLWLGQFIVYLQTGPQNVNRQKRFDLAISASAVFGLNGVLDFAVWMWSGQSVVRFDYRRRKSKHATLSGHESDREQLKLPLISDPGIVARQEVNAALRRDAMVCTSWAILDSVNVGQPAVEHARRDSIGGRDFLIASDFHKIYKKWIFLPDGRHKFEFKDYAPETFAQLRRSQAIEPDSYSTSFRNITSHDSDQELLEKFSDGKSGSFFYFSLDSRFIVKTVTKSELNFLRSILPHYYQYIKDNPDSLLTRIYGLHRVRLAPHQQYLSMTVMGNVLPHSAACKVHEKYDLKGSSVGRRVLKRAEDSNHLDLSKKTLKDCDLVRKIVVGEENKRRLLEQLRRDVEFLASVGVMDYSLLLGIHFCGESESNLGRSMNEQPAASSPTDSGLTCSSSGPDSENSLVVSDVGTGNAAVGNSSIEQEVREKYRPKHLRRGSRRNTYAVPPAARQSSRAPTRFLMVSEEGYVPWFRRDLGGIKGHDSRQPDQKSIYFMGVIDILQRYDWSKKTERFLKTKLLCKDGDNISAINVCRYSQRFVERIGEHFQ